MKEYKINYAKLDKYVYNVMMDMSGGIIRISVVDLFHHVKDDSVLYNILGRDIHNLEDRRKVWNYDYMIPILKNSLSRLERKSLMSEARKRRRGIDY